MLIKLTSLFSSPLSTDLGLLAPGATLQKSMSPDQAYNTAANLSSMSIAGRILIELLDDPAIVNILEPTGTNSGDVTLGAFGSTPSANGASLSGQVLTLQPASALQPGGVTTGAQVLVGAKTFSNGILTNAVGASSASTLLLTGAPTSNGSAVGTTLGSSTTLSTTGDKLLSVKNSSTEKVSIDKDGTMLMAAGAHLTIGTVATTPVPATELRIGGTQPSIYLESSGLVGSESNGVIFFGNPGFAYSWILACQVPTSVNDLKEFRLTDGSAVHWSVRNPGTADHNSRQYFGVNPVTAASDGHFVYKHGLRSTAAGVASDIPTLVVKGADASANNNGDILQLKTNTGTNVQSVSLAGKTTFDATDLSGTPGAAIINKPSGQVSIAAGAAAVVVTNSLVTTASVVVAVIQFVDATLTTLKTVVPGAGSFTITGNANATAATKIGFVVFN